MLATSPEAMTSSSSNASDRVEPGLPSVRNEELWNPPACVESGAPEARRAAAGAGFTLTEILVALGIVAALAGLAFGGGRHALGTARVARARAELAVVAVALDAHRVRHGVDPRSPDPAAFLAALAAPAAGRAFLDCARFTVVHPATGRPADPRHESRAVLADPWGRPYLYAPPDPARGVGRGRLFSAGPDGDPATEADNVRAG